MRFFGGVRLNCFFVGPQVIMSKLTSSIFIPKEFCVIEASAEFFGDTVRDIRNIEELFLHQSLCCLHHGGICRLPCFLILIVIEENLRFKDLPFGGSKTKLRMRDNLPRTLAHTDITDREFAVVTPIGVQSWIFIVRWNLGEIIQYVFN